MKGGGRISMPRNNSNGALATGAIAGSVLSGGSSTSTPVLTACPPEDKTFMCRLTRFFNSFKMILSLIITFISIIVVIWVAWYFWKTYYGSGKKRR